ncbi:ABC transporter permease [Methanolobus halotolerans]|uniref:ABC transporter permease n=1 Tax=Methanolobus halotolerans TaxID=2052935 RepID=A0A4E0PXY9_9EURY|nr:ABC transporter permease [Methanolobus halotolerans]TGC09700.1 ABC transporter permease [Methanolobus halotolerans]
MYELQIALRHISARKRLTFFAIFAVALAIGVIVVLMSMMSGFTEELVTTTVENSPHIVVSPMEDDQEYIHFYNHFSEQLRNKEGVLAVSPVFSGQVALQYKDNAEGVDLFGIDPEAENAVVNIEDDIVSGRLFELSRTNNGIVLGDNLAEDLDVVVGDSVDAVIPTAGSRSFRVVGIFNSGTPADENTAYARFDTVRDLFGESGVASRINVRVQDPYQAEMIAQSVESETGLDAVSWIEANSEILELLNTQQVFVWIFYGLIYMIAGFGVANTLITVVMDKKKEIGMLMAMGTSKKHITAIFLLESLILGTIGVLVGCVLGYAGIILLSSYEIDLPSEMYFGLTTLPLKVDLANFVYAIVFSFLINIIAAVYPARRAARLDPVEAIESE